MLTQCTQQQPGAEDLLQPAAAHVLQELQAQGHYFGHIVSGLAMKSNVLKISEVKILVPRSNLQATHLSQWCGQACLVSRLSSETAAPGREGRNSNEISSALIMSISFFLCDLCKKKRFRSAGKGSDE